MWWCPILIMRRKELRALRNDERREMTCTHFSAAVVCRTKAPSHYKLRYRLPLKVCQCLVQAGLKVLVIALELRHPPILLGQLGGAIRDETEDTRQRAKKSAKKSAKNGVQMGCSIISFSTRTTTKLLLYLTLSSKGDEPSPKMMGAQNFPWWTVKSRRRGPYDIRSRKS